MNGSEIFDLSDSGRQAHRREVSHPRAVGSPLPTGSGARPALPQGQGGASNFGPPPPGRALANTSAGDAAADAKGSSLERALSALRMAVPFVQRMLPLLDGNIATAVANLLTPHPQKAAPPVNLAPVENGLAELHTQHRELREQVMEQNTSLKRVEDQLEMVREATDRNTLEQQELLEDLKTVGTKVNTVALIALGLLLISVCLNLVLYLHIQRVLP